MDDTPYQAGAAEVFGQNMDVQQYLQPGDGRKRADGGLNAGQTLVEGELHGLHANDGPAGSVVQHHPAGVLAAGRSL